MIHIHILFKVAASASGKKHHKQQPQQKETLFI